MTKIDLEVSRSFEDGGYHYVKGLPSPKSILMVPCARPKLYHDPSQKPEGPRTLGEISLPQDALFYFPGIFMHQTLMGWYHTLMGWHQTLMGWNQTLSTRLPSTGGRSGWHQELRDTGGGGFCVRLSGGGEGYPPAGATIAVQRTGETPDELRRRRDLSDHRAGGFIVSLSRERSLYPP